MSKQEALTERLHDAIGGEWSHTQGDAPLQGFSANFPKFRSDAIVGVVNAAADMAGAKERAVAFSTGEASERMGDNPQAPREVVVPEALASNAAFQEQLTADMRQTITAAVSQQLSHGAARGLHAR